jgi:glycosyltransferase involved in cell wall biosynthesis
LKVIMAHKFFHPSGGPETVMFQSIRILNSLGHEVIPFSMRHPRNLATPYSRYFVPEVDYRNHKGDLPGKLKAAFGLIYSLEARRRMEALIDDTEPDLAHLHNIYHQISPSIITALKRRGIPVVMTLHDFKLVCPNYTFFRQGTRCELCEGKHFYKAVVHRCVKDSFLASLLCAAEMYIHKMLRIYSQGVDRFIVLSQFSKEKMIQYGLPREKMRVLPNAVEVDEDPLTATPGSYIIFLGRLSEKNGISTLVQAMKQLPEVTLRVAGEGELESSLRQYVAKEGLDNVEFLGFVTGERLKRLVRECSFTVFPSLCYHNCPMSILEAFSYAKPVIGANLGSVPELAEDNKTGLLFEPGNIEDLASKIDYLYRKPQLIKKLGQNALNRVKENHSRERYYQELLQIYEGLIQRRKRNRIGDEATDKWHLKKAAETAP